jgi:polar amino acid transport system permease protein
LEGAVLILLGISRHRAVKSVSQSYIYLIQGTPLLIVLFVAYFGASFIGLDVQPIVAITVAFTLYASAFLGEIWRGALDAVPRGQSEAAYALGLSRWQTMRHITAPQAVRIATPPTVGFLVQLIKGTSLASIVGITELTRTAQIVSNATFKPLPVFLTAGAFYFFVCFPLTVLSRMLEKRIGQQQGKPLPVHQTPA